MKKILVGIGVIILGGIVILLLRNNPADTGVKKDAPQDTYLSMDDRYQELEKEYGESMGVSLQLCTKSYSSSNPTIYVLEASGGFGGETYYYDREGRELAWETWDDIGYNDKTYLDLKAYNCDVIKETDGFPHD